MFNYNNNKIIAIGDIHGDYYIFIELLKMAKVINSDLKWTGKDTFVIQLGDTLDGKRPGVNIDSEYLKTTGEIEITNLILNLDKQAKKQYGRVISILGNHELYPYYYYNDISFNDKYVKTSDLENYKKFYKVSRFKYYKPGYGEGAKLLGQTRPLIIQLGKFIFCHGSLSKEFLQLCISNNLTKTNNSNFVDITKLNKIVSDWLIGNTKKVPFFINVSDNINPLFNRNLTNPKSLNKTECIDLVDSVLKYFNNGEYLVMGHSTHKNINTLCNNKVYRTDIAISRAFGGTLRTNMKRLQVLEINQKNNCVRTNIITPKGKIKIL
uniref:Calcineurin-like phosphoesterase domain-containing protein n=1 Tax=viral metagenome TaxID=1070528 RepID=A0A6C0LDF9_9ZZZZ